ncbi:hypothetical protein K1719_030976 [Acacia pycnantha]|nr:hypothetical protein K1719_030976 [Acacia pycnantha]
MYKSVYEGNGVTKYFVSSGFVFIHANSVADVIAIEAFPIDHIDQSLVQKGLTEFTQKLTSATTDLEKAEAQIGIDVHMPLILLSLANALLRKQDIVHQLAPLNCLCHEYVEIGGGDGVLLPRATAQVLPP